MSRIGNKPINVPDGVEVTIDGHHITVKGPKGTLEKDLHKNMTVTLNDKVITVTRCDDEPENRKYPQSGAGCDSGGEREVRGTGDRL